LQSIDEDTNGALTIDIDETTYERRKQDVIEYIPQIPNLRHWFRRRVTIQLAEIARLILTKCEARERPFFLLAFASIIRNSSNADPVPVSGLEVTRHMRQREAAGRSIDAYGLMKMALQRHVVAAEEFALARAKKATARFAVADARALNRNGIGIVDAVITSPPYLTAVDYYRRHQLEMYWLGLIASASDRLAILPRYIGRHNISLSQLREEGEGGVIRSKLGRQWHRRLAVEYPNTARNLLHYSLSMARVPDRFLEVVRPGGRVIVVVGDSQIRGQPFSTGKLIGELAPKQLALGNVLWYPIENRYMSYSRQNGASIKMEQVLCFQRT
jgi:hypothetical protein